MKDITSELEKKDCIICMRCGRIYQSDEGEEVSLSTIANQKCDCGNSHFNYVYPNGEFITSFWGSDAENLIHDEFNK